MLCQHRHGNRLRLLEGARGGGEWQAGGPDRRFFFIISLMSLLPMFVPLCESVSAKSDDFRGHDVLPALFVCPAVTKWAMLILITGELLGKSYDLSTCWLINQLAKCSILLFIGPS